MQPAPRHRLSQSLELPARSLSAGRRRRDRQHGPHQAPLLRQPAPRESDRHRAAGAAARFFGAARPRQVRELGCAWRLIVAVSQALRAGQVEPSIPVDDHAIVAPRLLRGDKAVEHVVEDALWIARAWISDAAAPRQFEADRVAWRHGLPSFRPDGPAGAQRHCAGRARAAAVASARWVVHALEIAQKRDRRGAGAAELDHLAEPTAKPAGTAGALAEFTAIEDHRGHALGRFHGYRAHARWERGRAEPVLGGARAGAAAVEDHGAEFRQRVRIGPLLDFIDEGAAAEDLRIPERGGA